MDAKSLQQKERKCTVEERELYNVLKPFLRFQTVEEHDNMVQLLIKERKLRTKLFQLMLWKVLGLESVKDITAYEERMQRIEGYKEFLVKHENDPSRRNERRLRISTMDQKSSSSSGLNNSANNAKLKITDFMEENEIEFCYQLKLPPIAYFLAKRVLLHEVATNPIYTLDNMCTELRIDGTKQGRIFDFLLLLNPKALQNMQQQVCDLTCAKLDSHGYIDPSQIVSEMILTSSGTSQIYNKFACNKITSYFGASDGNERPTKQQRL